VYWKEDAILDGVAESARKYVNGIAIKSPTNLANQISRIPTILDPTKLANEIS
jgi:hypothetical protein